MPPKTVKSGTDVKQTAPVTKGKVVKRNVGLGKVKATKRVAKVYRDNIKGITNPALKRLLRRAGVKRISHPVYQRLRDIISQRLTEVVNIAGVYMSTQDTKTLTPEYVQEALKQLGQTIAIGGLKAGSSGVFKRRTGASRPRPAEGSEDAPRKRANTKTGVVAMRDIRREQKQSDRFALQCLPFQRLVRELFQTQSVGLGIGLSVRVNALAFDLLQLYIETTVVGICTKASMLAQHAGRGTVQVQDLDLVEALAHL